MIAFSKPIAPGDTAPVMNAINATTAYSLNAPLAIGAALTATGAYCRLALWQLNYLRPAEQSPLEILLA
jgi:hypothetical protein